jgi:8-oxo-dGTP pyrophosphatase MutT (NUDIX family)
MDLGNKITKSGAYIIDPINKKILIIISNTDPIKIGIPKGSIEDNEKIYECAEREIKEETGLEIRIINKKKTRRIFDGVYFFVYINNGSKKFIPNPNKLNKREIKESKWVDINFLEENKAFCNVTLKHF